MVGAIGPHKGYDVLARLVERAARDRAPFFLTVIGFTADDERITRYENAEITGSYKASELGTLLAEADPDFVFLSSIWPETYSYVLSEIWATGHHVVAFDIGAPADRIRSSGGGILIPLTHDIPALLDSLMVARDQLAALQPMSYTSAFAPSLEAYYAQWIQWPTRPAEVLVPADSSWDGGRAGITHKVSRSNAVLAFARASSEMPASDFSTDQPRDMAPIAYPNFGRPQVLPHTES